MKQIFDFRLDINRVIAFGIVWVAVIFIACSDMNDLHQPFLDRGEITYAAKVDSVATHLGKNRIQFELIIKSQRIKTVRIYWNDYKDQNSDVIMFRDSSDVDISGKGVFKKILDNMDERSYIFKLVSFDEFENPSLPTEIHAYVYGSKYEKLLVPRSVRSTAVDNAGKMKISWGIADGAYGSEIRYTDVSDQVKVKSVPIAESVSLIDDIKSGTLYEFRTVYKPDTTGIDNFYTDYVTADPHFAFDKKDWQIIAFSTNHGGNDNKVGNFIDGTEKTRWHSCAGCSSYPHFATIDMGATKTVTRFGVWITTFEVPAGDNRAPDKIEFFVSKDNVTYTSVGTFNFNRFLLGEQIFDIADLPQGRYFKFVAVSGPVNDQMVIGEISAYGF